MNGIKKCDITDKNYPLMLKNAKKSLKPIYYIGNLEAANSSRTVAIIGKRSCSSGAMELSYRAGQLAAKQGLIVVNGLAIGCDEAALHGALHEGGKCVAVMAGGLDEIYPKRNQNLAKEILEKKGCLLSEYPPGIRPSRYSFVERDQVQSGLSCGVLAIECDINGGTMHTIKAAIRQKKRIAAYAEKLVNYATGNREIQNIENSTIIESEDQIVDFYLKITDEIVGEQLSFLV